MNVDIIVTGNTFGSTLLNFLILKNFDVSLVHIVPEISIIKDIRLIIPASTFKNLSIPFKLILESGINSYNKIHFYLANQERVLQHEKKILFSTTLDRFRKFLFNNIKTSKSLKTIQASVKELHFSDNKIILKLSNNRVLSCQYLIVCDDFWGSTWNLLNFKPQHTGGWIIKIPQTKLIQTKPFIALGYSKKALVISDSETIIFAKHISKEYTIEDLIYNFLLTSRVVEKLVINEWNKYVLPITTKVPHFPEEIRAKRIFFITEYLGLMNCFIPEYTTLTSMLSKELIDNLDIKIKVLEDFIPTISKIIEYNQIFMKLINFINSFPLVFFKNDDKDKIITDLLLGNITPDILDQKFKNIFENYGRNFDIVLSDRALNES